jgi:hypothetical protein
MTQETQEIKVIFRKWKNGGGVIALFPRIPAHVLNPYICLSYEHHGQHGGAFYGEVLCHTEAATPEEYACLKAELEELGYDLYVAQRRMHEDVEILLKRHKEWVDKGKIK